MSFFFVLALIFLRPGYCEVPQLALALEESMPDREQHLAWLFDRRARPPSLVLAPAVLGKGNTTPGQPLDIPPVLGSSASEDPPRFSFELELSQGASTSEIGPVAKADLRRLLESSPKIFPESSHGPGMWLFDTLLVQSLTLVHAYLGSKVGWTDWDQMVAHLRKKGPFGFSTRFAAKDDNHGDAWDNGLHTLASYAVPSYYKLRGYRDLSAFLGGTLWTFLKTYFYENYERVKSSHELVLHFLGSLFGSFDRLGMRMGVDPLRPGDVRRHVWEFYYRPGDTRFFARLEPKGHWKPGTQRQEVPYIPYDISAGLALEPLGLSGFVTAVTDPEIKEAHQIRGIFGAIKDVRLGLGVDVLKSVKSLSGIF